MNTNNIQFYGRIYTVLTADEKIEMPPYEVQDPNGEIEHKVIVKRTLTLEAVSYTEERYKIIP
jgi:hypothetical protein